MADRVNVDNTAYVEGNTVRRQQTAPDYRQSAPKRRETVPDYRRSAPKRQEAAPDRRRAVPDHRQAAPKRPPVLPEKSREEIIRDRERRLSAKRNRERTQSINLGYVLFLTAATAVCFCACILFVHLQSDITSHMAAVTSLETQVSELKSDNDAAENRLESEMTLSEVKLRAAELGLVYPSSAQIQYYSVENSDYMNQYSDVEPD
ncbi:MAG: hypothetical protein LIO75_04810 [Lachnospiraceae bacterium]|nr:hypothetical protein [Lachnospiraceae bacterium]